MQKIILIPVLLFGMACNSRSDSGKVAKRNADSSFVITGNIGGLGSGWVYLYHVERSTDKIDSVTVKDGSFLFKGKISHPEYCLLGFEEQGQKQFPLGFFLDNSNISVNGSRDSLADARVEGSPTQNELKLFDEKTKHIDTKNKELMRQYQVAMAGKDTEKIDSIIKVARDLEEDAKNIVLQFAKENPASYVSAFQVAQTFSSEMDPIRVEPVYSAFDPALKESYFGKSIKENLEAAKQTSLGSAAPDFTLNDVNGKPISLASFKGKYTLVDFWASWCGPCRQENPEVVKAYHAYNSKGFEILGVSLDEEKDSWVGAIAKDKLDWTQVSDLKGWQSDVAALYGVRAIPMNYLLDKEGKIIAKGLRGEELNKKLAEVLK